MSIHQPAIRVLVIGDAGVGKSTLISSFLTGTFTATPPAPVLPAAVLPSLGDLPQMVVVDTPSGLEGGVIPEDVRRADVAVVVYACDDPNSVRR